MKKLIGCLVVSSMLLVSQDRITLSTGAPSGVSGVSVNRVGNRGNTTYYYWVIANFPIGSGNPNPLAIALGSADTLSATNYNRVTWIPVTTASSVDILRTTTAYIPVPCTCALSTGVAATSNSYNDQSNSASSYTYSPAGGATATFQLDNTRYAQARVNLDKALNLPILGEFVITPAAGKSTLPTASTVVDRLAMVTDSATAGSCTVGGGSLYSICIAAVSGWQKIGGGGGGSGCATVGTAGEILTDDGAGGCTSNLATLDGSGNMSTPGSVSTGVGSGNAGVLYLKQGTTPAVVANETAITVPASVTGYKFQMPAAAGTGIIRSDNSGTTDVVTQSELSGDATTSGSNAVTVGKVNGGSIPASANTLGSDGSSKIVVSATDANCTTPTFNAGGTTAVSFVTSKCASITGDNASGATTVTIAGLTGAGPYILFFTTGSNATVNTFTLPGTLIGASTPSIASTTIINVCSYNRTTLNCVTPGSSESQFVMRGGERAIVGISVPSNQAGCGFDSTNHVYTCVENSNTTTTVKSDTGAAHNFLTAISAAGVISKAQPAFSDVSGNPSNAQVGLLMNNYNPVAANCFSTDGGSYNPGSGALTCANAFSGAQALPIVSYTFPANTITATALFNLSLEVQCIATSASPVGFNVIVSLGGTAVFTQSAILSGCNGSIVAPGKTGGYNWTLRGTAAAGASALVECYGDVGVNQTFNANPSTPYGAAVATNGTLALTVTVQFTANTAGNGYIFRAASLRQVSY